MQNKSITVSQDPAVAWPQLHVSINGWCMDNVSSVVNRQNLVANRQWVTISVIRQSVVTDDLWLEHGGASKGYTCASWAQGMYQSSRSNIAFSCCRPHDICIPVYNHPTSLFSFITHHTWISCMCYKWHPKWSHSSYVVKALCDKLTHCTIKIMCMKTISFKTTQPVRWRNKHLTILWPSFVISRRSCRLGSTYTKVTASSNILTCGLLGTLTHDCMTTQLWIAALWHNYRFKFQLQL